MERFQLCAFADEAGADIEDQIKALKENGISFIELRGIGNKSIVDLSCNEAIQLKKLLDKDKIKVWSIGSPIGKITITDDFNPHMELFLHTLKIAEIMEAPCIRLFSFYMPKDENPIDYRDEVIRRLSAICEAAKDSNVILCHENEKGIYGDNAERCLDILKNVQGLSGIFDPANFIQCGQEIRSAFDLLFPYIYYFHIKDAVNGENVVPAGCGDGEIPYILEKCKNKNGIVLSIEPHLALFNGLDKLENGEKSIVDAYTYESQREAFDAAVVALKNLL